MAMSIRFASALLLLRSCRNEGASYRHKVPIAAVKDSLEQSQSGFQRELRPNERFFNRDPFNLLKIRYMRM